MLRNDFYLTLPIALAGHPSALRRPACLGMLKLLTVDIDGTMDRPG